MNEAFLCLGGNMGNRMATLQMAVACLSSDAGKVIKLSEVVETEPWQHTTKNKYLNLIVALQTNLSAEQLLQTCLNIEQRLGRVRTAAEGYSDRIIDIDLIFFNQAIIRQDNLEIPHPRFALRRFVLQPLAQIAPHHIDPLSGKSISYLLENCSDPLMVKVLGPLPPK